MDRRELGSFLRSRRERISPEEVGLPAGRRRRTPGLRREEVARLAFISTEYYTRLEQARAPRPSREVLAGVARALRLSDAEREHMHHLAGSPPGPPSGPSREVRPSILALLERLPNAAAMVLSATYEVIAWNALAAALLEDFSAVPPRGRNLLRRYFLGSGRELFSTGADGFAGSAARRLRAAAARYPDDPEVAGLVRELLEGSAEFAELWDSHDVCARPALCKTLRHPVVGPVTVVCDVLDIADRDQQVVIYTAEPGTPAEEALRLLSVVGTQRMASEGV
ncbi:helix-turn-helix transcriptional regulator [Nocardiopsis suaedae]|uniref:Helix-turn-helix transcriptional regulator n=1 Tax=Nocardiopsis suaedae TaxID=3018444 RepID=A0ABT4TVP4_9ACTN|nr:helix-turn-helix transcriptional regulator [Nocardiopsis suaedae]MDA2808766.1 helix-turn-helix transcriptional regulator [Nocardiopsis suaedae]